MVEYVGDPIAFSHLVGLKEALVAELDKRNLPPVCFAGVVPGAEAAIDYVDDGCEGFAWVRLSTMYPSVRFPEPDAVPSHMITLAWGIEMAIMRPKVTPDNGEPSSVEDQFESTRLQLADMYAMLTVLCAYPEAHQLGVVVGAYEPLGPQGSSVGGGWTATLGGS